ncbi:MAG: glucose 1-dehydrogenase [Bacteroides sp.]|nr:glucose 1-dehydrogenase [Bacteroides sp.]
MYKDLKGKVGVVTGSTSGIGAAIIRRFIDEEMKVVINYLDNEQAAEKMVEEIRQKGGEAVAAYADVKSEEDMAHLLHTTLEAYGDLDVWVNNAGVQKSVPSHQLPLAEWQRVIDTNLTGVFIGAREAINYFLRKNKRGNIINISSVHEIIPWPTYAHYTASKGGVKLLTQTLALEYASRGIRINSVAPGGIDTPINTEKVSGPQYRKGEEAGIPLGYIGTPEEIANVAVWLASGESSYVTGTTIIADGGLVLYPSPEDSQK